MRLQENPFLSADMRMPDLVRQLDALWRNVAQQVNQLSEGQINAATNAATAAPTTGTYVVGDYVRNAAPAILGTAGARYTIQGWCCVVAGTPGTWAACRSLTGT